MLNFMNVEVIWGNYDWNGVYMSDIEIVVVGSKVNFIENLEIKIKYL